MFSSVFLRFRPLFHTFGQKSKKLTKTDKNVKNTDENIKKLTKSKKSDENLKKLT